MYSSRSRRLAMRPSYRVETAVGNSPIANPIQWRSLSAIAHSVAVTFFAAFSHSTIANAPTRGCSNRQEFCHGYQNLKLVELFHEANLELLQVAKALQLRPFTEIHDREYHHPVMNDFLTEFPNPLQGKLFLNGSHAGETVQQLQLEGNVFRLRNRPVIVVVQWQGYRCS